VGWSISETERYWTAYTKSAYVCCNLLSQSEYFDYGKPAACYQVS